RSGAFHRRPLDRRAAGGDAHPPRRRWRTRSIRSAGTRGASPSAAHGQVLRRAAAGQGPAGNEVSSARFPILLALLLRCWRARAQDEDRTLAMARFRAASEAYGRGEYAAAARAFEESYRLVPRAAAVYNAARAWQAAGERARAADDYEAALKRTDLLG